jgi:hypothetical protein
VARKTVFVSDLSGREIPNDRDAVTITIKFGDTRRSVYVVDAHPEDAEVKKLLSAGRPARKESPYRGRDDPYFSERRTG